MASISSPTAPIAPKIEKVIFSTSTDHDAPIRSVVVYTQDRAEVTRVINCGTRIDTLGLHEVELTGLPGPGYIDEQSVAVKGSGYCTILDVSFSDQSPIMSEPTEEEEEKIKAENARVENEMRALTVKNEVLTVQLQRTEQKRELVDNFARRATATVPSSDSGDKGGQGHLDVKGVGTALEFWEEKAVQTDEEMHRLKAEQQRVKDELGNLTLKSFAPVQRRTAQQHQAKVVVSLNVEEIGPIELEVKYMVRGASWSPAYDLRVDTQTDSMSCTYYGTVTQTTTEDWEGVELSLSTAEPGVKGTPPTLGTKTVCLKSEDDINLLAQQQSSQQRQRNLLLRRQQLIQQQQQQLLQQQQQRQHQQQQQQQQQDMGLIRAPFGSAPPRPPQALTAVAAVASAGGGIGTVSFPIKQSTTIKSDGCAKRLTIGVLELSAEVTHYIVPSKASAAYLQAKATNNTDYLLLASSNVSIFFDNSFVAKTNLRSVSPGESFQTFLGVDPAVKTKVAPPRKTKKRKGIFGKSHQVVHAHSTSISNGKKVPVTCVVVDASPRSADDVIKVSLQQPAPASVQESVAVSDEQLVTEALEKSSVNSSGLPIVAGPVKTGVLSVSKNSSNHLAWVVKVAPQGEIQIPLEYTVEWPMDKEVDIKESYAS